jgi:orotidine-5'-phosphate decarboxylase
VQAATDGAGRSVDATLLSAIAELNARLAPGEIGPIGAVVGPSDVGGALDLVAAQGLFLAPGVGAQGATPADVARVFAACPERVMPSSSRALLVEGPDVSRLREAVGTLAATFRAVLGTT